MTNSPLPLADEKSENNGHANGAAKARQRAAAVFSVPAVCNGARSQAEGLTTEMFRDIARTTLPIEFLGGEIELEAHAYEDDSASYQAMALVHRGEHHVGKTPLVRVHSGCVTGDIFHSLRCDCYAQLQLSLQMIVGSELGIIIYLPYHEGRGIGLVNKIKAYAEQDRGLDTVDANLSIGAPVDARDYELPAKILKDLGYGTIELMTNNPLKVEALQRHGIEVIAQHQTVTEPSEHNQRYLDTKRDRMAHKL